MDINNHVVGQCMFCGHTGCSGNSRDDSALATKRNQVFDLLFKTFCLSLRTNNINIIECCELRVQDLSTISTLNKSFIKKSKDMWRLIVIPSDKYIYSDISKLPLVLLTPLVRERDLHNGTLLMHAATENNEKYFKALINAGADVNAQDMHGRTALINATSSGNLNFLNILIENGADVNSKNFQGDTLLRLAKRSYRFHDNNKGYTSNEQRYNMNKCIERLENLGALDLGPQE